jgi:beta-lactam-binding protein with PASTA domain/beta-glucanase (GH16 family)
VKFSTRSFHLSQPLAITYTGKETPPGTSTTSGHITLKSSHLGKTSKFLARTGRLNDIRAIEDCSSGAKAQISCASNGTAKAAPFQSPAYATGSNHWLRRLSLHRTGGWWTTAACFVAFILLLLSTARNASAQSYTLVWSDEFNSTVPGSQPDPTVWAFDKGLTPDGAQSYNCLWGEADNGCNPSKPNVYLDGNGHLVIQALSAPGAPNGVTSGRLQTATASNPASLGSNLTDGATTILKSFQYGMIEARIQVPGGAGNQGVWPAFWALGTDFSQLNWPASGELDVMEYAGAQDPTHIYGTPHASGGRDSWGLPVTVSDASGWNTWHIYGITWTPNHMQWWIDDPSNVYSDFTTGGLYADESWYWPNGTQWPFNLPFYLLLDLNMGGSFPGNISSLTTYPQQMLVDWVRVYQTDPPAALGALTVKASSATQAQLSWGASTSASVTYNVYRSETANFTPSAQTTPDGHIKSLIAANVSGTSFTDSNLAPGMTYYYAVSASGGYSGEEFASKQASVTLPSTGAATGSQYWSAASYSGDGPYELDTIVSGGFVSTWPGVNPSTNDVANAAPADMYRAERLGNQMYAVGNLVPGASYNVRLHLMESFFTGPELRQFNVLIDGQQVLTEVDPFALAGAMNTLTTQAINTVADSNGEIIVELRDGYFDEPELRGLDVAPSTGGTAYGAPAGTSTYIAYAAGGPEDGIWQADENNGTSLIISEGVSAQAGPQNSDPNSYGGVPQANVGANNTPLTISTTGVAGAAPEQIYQNQRWGEFGYAFRGLLPKTQYTINLHFAETNPTVISAGERLFDISVNGKKVVANYDIFASAGGALKAVIKTLTASSDEHGMLTVQLQRGPISLPILNAIEVIEANSAVPTSAVPNVVGDLQGNAELLIYNAGLTIGTETIQSSTTVANGAIISTSPAAGAQVAPGTAINLVISSNGSSTPPTTVTVPNVVGQTQSAATSTLAADGLTSSVTQQCSATVASGNVISQSPAAGASVNSGSSVSLVVSTGSCQSNVTVPNVVGDTQAAATSAITGASLKVGTITQQCSATVASGNVISQSPAAGTSVASGSAVALTVSTGTCSSGNLSIVLQWPTPQVTMGAGTLTYMYGTESGGTQVSVAVQNTQTGLWLQANGGYGATQYWSPAGIYDSNGDWRWPYTPNANGAFLAVAEVTANGSSKTASSTFSVIGAPTTNVTVPNVVGDTQAAATSAITGAGLVLGSVNTQSSTTVARGNVISQSPAAATSVASGSAVNLIVSSGPAAITVPNVVGDTQAQATSSIQAAGLAVGAITQQASTTVPSGDVISQLPAAGAQVNSGQTVSLVISTGKPASGNLNISLAWPTPQVTMMAGQTVGVYGTENGSSKATVACSVQSASTGLWLQANGSYGATQYWFPASILDSNGDWRWLYTPNANGSFLVVAQVTDGSSVNTAQSTFSVIGASSSAVKTTVAAAQTLVKTAAITAKPATLTAQPAATTAPGITLAWPTPQVTMQEGTAVGIYGTETGDSSATVSCSVQNTQTGQWLQSGQTSYGTSQYWFAAGILDSAGDWRWLYTPNAPGAFEVICQVSDNGSTQSASSTFNVTGAGSSGGGGSPGTGGTSGTVPNVIGDTQTEAVSILEAAGYAIGNVAQVVSCAAQAGFVQSEAPISGTSLPPGNPVAIVVSTGPPATGCPQGNGDYPLQIVNGTNGTWQDSDIWVTVVGQTLDGHWAFVSPDGAAHEVSPALANASGHFTHNGVNYAAMSFSMASFDGVFTMPGVFGGGRVYLSVGAPLYISIAPDSSGIALPTSGSLTDPNAQTYWDYYEFTFLNGIVPFGGDTSQVDGFGFPINVEVQQASTGFDRSTYYLASRAAIRALFTNSGNADVAGLVISPYHVVSPYNSPSFLASATAKNFGTYIDSVWKSWKNGFDENEPGVVVTGSVQSDNFLHFTLNNDPSQTGTLHEPSASDIYGCTGNITLGISIDELVGAQICAAFQRGVAGNFANWWNPSYFYENGANQNPYAQIIHSVTSDHRAYAQPYDDVNDHSTIIITPTADPPSLLQLTVAW